MSSAETQPSEVTQLRVAVQNLIAAGAHSPSCGVRSYDITNDCTCGRDKAINLGLLALSASDDPKGQ